MIVRTTDEIAGTDRDVASENGNWTSKRIEFHYANHVEAVWLVEGEGTLTDRETGDQYPLAPGTMYLLNGHERHTVQPRTRMRMLCVFNPPVTGREVHDENGVYPLITVD